MAKRDLDNEFKEQLNGQGPFQFSEDNWKAASAMLDKGLPVAAGGSFLNRTTIILSVFVVLLFGLTFILPVSRNSVEPNGTEFPNSFQSNTEINDNVISNSSSSSQSSAPSNYSKEDGAFKQSSPSSTAIESNVNETISRNEEDIAASEIADQSKDLRTETTVDQNNNEIEKFNAKQTTTEVSTIKKATAIAATGIIEKTLTPRGTNTSFDQSSNSIYDQTGSDEDEFNNESGSGINSGVTEIDSETGNDPTMSNQTLTGGEKVTTNQTQQSDSGEHFPIEEVVNKEVVNKPNDDVQSKIRNTNSVQNSSYFRVGFETGIFSTTRTLNALDVDCENYVAKRNSQETMKPSYYFGLNFGQQINKLNWQIGLNYSTYQENISYNNEVLGLDLLDNGYWNQFNTVDTTLNGRWVIDSIYAGHWDFDTAYTNVVDSNYIEQWDTTIATKLDSSMGQNNGVHNLSYFEVPLFLGYTFGKDKWLFDVQPGVSIGFLSGSSGSRYIDKSLSGLVDPAISLEQFNKVVWKVHFRVGVRYSFDKLDIGVYPHYSYTLNNVLNSNKVDQRYGNLGLSFGVYYKF
jgi:hypothetical protein